MQYLEETRMVVGVTAQQTLSWKGEPEYKRNTAPR